MPQVIVNIDAEGNVKVEALGVIGSGCMQLTRALESALGHTTADEKKPLFYQQEQQQQRAGQ